MEKKKQDQKRDKMRKGISYKLLHFFKLSITSMGECQVGGGNFNGECQVVGRDLYLFIVEFSWR